MIHVINKENIRTNSKVEKYLSLSQSAYRKNRSTSDIIWTYKWIIAKAQKYQNTKVYITGIDMSSAFDTIHREKLLNQLSNFIDEDELRMCRLLLSETCITVKNDNVTFKSNLGSPQGDGISGTFSISYFENALRKIRTKLYEHQIEIEHLV